MPHLRARSARVIVDAAGDFQTTYAATGGSGYLVRPDGYLGFRATPIGTAALRNHLERVFAAQTPTHLSW